jgi:hypothetical protein
MEMVDVSCAVDRPQSGRLGRDGLETLGAPGCFLRRMTVVTIRRALLLEIIAPHPQLSISDSCPLIQPLLSQSAAMSWH